MKRYKRILTVLILVLVILTPFISSCSRRLNIPGQNKTLPSSYTHSGKYVNFHSLGLKHDGIRRYSLKCPVSSERK